MKSYKIILALASTFVLAALAGWGAAPPFLAAALLACSARAKAKGGRRTWSPEVCVVNDPAIGEVAEGAGNDGAGAMLLWVRCWGRGGVRHALYRSGDGVAFEKIADPEPVCSWEPGRNRIIFSTSGYTPLPPVIDQ